MCLLKSYIDDKNQKNHAGIIPEGGIYTIVNPHDGSWIELHAGEKFPAKSKEFESYTYGDYRYSYTYERKVDYNTTIASLKYTYTPCWVITSAPLKLREMPLVSINGLPVFLDGPIMKDRFADNPDIADEILSNHEKLSIPSGTVENDSHDEH